PDEQAARREVRAGEGDRVHARDLCELEVHLPQRAPARRQLLHSRGQHGSAVRAHRQRRDALERKPHRPRLDDRGPHLHRVTHRRLGTRARRPVLLYWRERDAAQRDHHRAADIDRRRRRDHEEHGRGWRISRATPDTRRQAQRRDHALSGERGERWKKLGFVFRPSGDTPWRVSHAATPTAEVLGGTLVRVYFTSRDRANRSHISYVELDLKAPSVVKRIAAEPLVAPGPPGTFDDSGAAMGCLVKDGNRRFLYYVGWNLSDTVPWRNSAGL